MGLWLTGQQGRLQLQRKELAKPRELRQGRSQVSDAFGKDLPWTPSSSLGNVDLSQTAGEMERKEEKRKGREEKDHEAIKVGRRTQKQLSPELLKS